MPASLHFHVGCRVLLHAAIQEAHDLCAGAGGIGAEGIGGHALGDALCHCPQDRISVVGVIRHIGKGIHAARCRDARLCRRLRECAKRDIIKKTLVSEADFMDRCITTHRLRKTCEPSPEWTLTTLDEGGLPFPVQVTVPSTV